MRSVSVSEDMPKWGEIRIGVKQKKNTQKQYYSILKYNYILGPVVGISEIIFNIIDYLAQNRSVNNTYAVIWSDSIVCSFVKPFSIKLLGKY